jgi:glutamyl-tRNA reductase
MSVLVVGLSHHSAPMSLLERAALSPHAVGKLIEEVATAEYVAEAVVLSTCNRVEGYADVGKFHAGVAELSELIARHCHVPLESLTQHLYVHYDDRAVQHLLNVACGLDSMVVGETQVLGQVKTALRRAQEHGTAGRVLNELFQHALRVGKRAHYETGIDRAGASLVSVGLDRAAAVVGRLAGRKALVVGAGSMSALAAMTLHRSGVGELLIANRTGVRGERLAAEVGGRALPLDRLAGAFAEADVVVSCTGATGIVVTAADITDAARDRAGRPLFVLDLALPRDIDPEVGQIAGVTLLDLEGLSAVSGAGESISGDIDHVRRIVAEEIAVFAGLQQAARVAPTVVALRSMAAEVVAAELDRLDGRRPGLDPMVRSEVARTVWRVVDKLLHAPTVRVKELAGRPTAASYAEALGELFDLDLAAVEAVTRPQPPDAPAELEAGR